MINNIQNNESRNQKNYQKVFLNLLEEGKLLDKKITYFKNDNCEKNSNRTLICEKHYQTCENSLTLNKDSFTLLAVITIKYMLKPSARIMNEIAKMENSGRWIEVYEPHPFPLSEQQIQCLELIKDLIKRRNKETLNKKFEEIN